MNKENKILDRNYQYFISNQQWAHLGYLTYCKQNNILRDKRIEGKKYEEYLEYIVKNDPNNKVKAIKAKQVLNRSSKKRKEQINEFWNRYEK
ncbi:1692_t:CDS:2 [Gigaspora rosea]|nr:1692_t:CDS:2 [Gigaspora rosea]